MNSDQAIRMIRIAIYALEGAEAAMVDMEWSDTAFKAQTLLELNGVTLKLYDINKAVKKQKKK